MKKVKTLYWIFTRLFVAFMLVSSLSQVLSTKGTVDVMNALKMPTYILPLLGIAKLSAIVVILVPGFAKLKEWAYAGFMFDFIGATYSMIAAGATINKWGFMILPVVLCVLSYVFYGKMKENNHLLTTGYVRLPPRETVPGQSKYH